MADAVPTHWTPPEGGDHYVAINLKTYEARQSEVDDFLGRPIWKLSSNLIHEQNSYVIFSFREKADADSFMAAFAGEPFDLRDKGRGSKWMYWYKGRAAKRSRNRSPYDFS